MSTAFRQFRKNSTAQGRFKDLVADYQRFVAEQQTVDNPDFRVRARVIHSKLVYHDPFIASKVKNVSTAFYMPFEPDQLFCVGMWDLDHNGRYMRDGSGYGHHGQFLNNPGLKAGIDLGFGTSSYVNFDGQHFYGYVDNHPPLRLSTAGLFSITVRIYPTDISASDGFGGTKYRTIIHKADTSWPDGTKAGQIDGGSVGNGYHLAVIPDGKIRFTLIQNGIRYSAETLSGIITASDPPIPFDITVTVNTRDKKPIPAELYADPGDHPGADPEAEPFITPPLLSPRIEISVNERFFQIYTTAHLSFIDDPIRRLRVGAVFNYNSLTPPIANWFKFKGGIQQLRIYREYLLTAFEILNLFNNRLTTREMPFGSPAIAGQILVFEDPSLIFGGFDPLAYDPDGFELSLSEFGISGLPGFDPLGFETFGFDTTPITEQGTLQNGGFDPRGFSFQGFHTIPNSQS